jgi:hypothetical protein
MTTSIAKILNIFTMAVPQKTTNAEDGDLWLPFPFKFWYNGRK